MIDKLTELPPLLLIVLLLSVISGGFAAHDKVDRARKAGIAERIIARQIADRLAASLADGLQSESKHSDPAR